MITAEAVKKLRAKTGCSVIECKKALEEVGGDEVKAQEVLVKRGVEIAGKKAERQTRDGLVASYIHPNQKIGVLLQVDCETDFVARNENLRNFSHELCLHIGAMDPVGVEELLAQPFIKNPEQTIQDLLNVEISKLGENIKISKFIRFQI